MTEAIPPERAAREVAREFERLRAELRRAVIGHDEIVDLVLIGFFAGGHVLVEGAPGTGKTLLVRSLAEALHLSFRRVQFTVDLLPADITGTRILEEEDGKRRFRFVPGPLFSHVLLADEINRATPKTQSALLEAMAELQCTVAGVSHAIEPPFFVMATLNPIEMEGTYPLPEAQLDRFLFKIVVPYPSQEELCRILETTTAGEVGRARPVFAADEAVARCLALRQVVPQVLVAPHLIEYAATLVRATLPANRRDDTSPQASPIDRYVAFGASPRGGQALLLGAKVRALLDGRVHVTQADIDSVAVPALAHRLVLNYNALADGIDAAGLIAQLVADVGRRRR